MNSNNGIPEDIDEIMSYLAYEFARTMKDPVQDKEDLYQDLVVLYLENLESGVVADVNDKNHWFTFFKSRLINKYNRLVSEREIRSKFKPQSGEDQTLRMSE